MYNDNFKKYDQFYTNPLISDELVYETFQLLPSTKNGLFFEPSAGTGSFLISLRKNGIMWKNIQAYDIDPKMSRIKKEDYLLNNFPFDNNKVIIGNPPFGYRGKLALNFLNKALDEANVVAFILPNIFRRYSVQKLINKNSKLVYEKNLNENSFILNDKEYKVKCVYQIWMNNNIPTFQIDKRILLPPKIKHKDFQTWIHNNTINTLKYFDKNKYNWDFAVVRQGYYDYSIKITNPNELIKNRQYFFVKAISQKILQKINKIDFVKLSKKNTQVLGFSTSDFVEEYMNIGD